jgi:ribosomal protein S18 acetylase RimI-like enzyme
METNDLHIRLAERRDLPDIVGLLADDPLGAKRECHEDPLPLCYAAAFEAIDEDPRNHLVVAEFQRRIIGCLQLTYIPGLSHQGGERAQIEGVRVAAEARGRSVGRQLFLWAIAQARNRDCRMVQLTTDKTRSEAHEFYGSLGFHASHLGMKLML